ncbi:MAG: SulP family inorganic anion transporter [Xanthomonadales bacterium]|nr:SulP family inorganic anion transporter [Xanthomonadales bacterium]
MAEEAAETLKGRIQQELDPSRLIPNLTAGAVVSVVVVIVSISLGTLIFGGKLEAYLPTGLGIMLFSGILITACVSLFSSYSGMIAYPQERVAPILAVMAAAITAQLTGRVELDIIFYTVVAAISITSLANGVFLWGLGFFKLGALIRFIPYPVIGGFLAGTGYLLVRGSLGVMTGIHIDMEHLHELFEGQHLYQWICGAAFGTLIVVMTHIVHRSWVLPAILVGGIVAFYGIMSALGVSAEAARMDGWLLGPFPEGEPWKPIAFEAMSKARWDPLIGQIGNIGTILLISIISVLLNSGALELIVKKDIDLNRELKVAGGANVLIGLGGGTVGFHSLSISRLSFQMGADSRMVGIIAAVACALMLFLGSGVMEYLPRTILGGLLFFLGMHFLIDWVYESYFKLTKADYAVVIMILGFVAAFGYLHGVVVGIIACVILFLVNYAKIDVIKHALTGTHQHSNVDRPGKHRRFLEEHGDRLFIFKLQGFIFFGTANGLLEQVRQRLAEADKERLDFMVLDFKAVTGIDSSSVLSFVKMLQLAEKNHFTLVFTHLTPDIERLLNKEGFDKADPKVFRTFDDLDYGLEWCENEILARNDMGMSNYEKLTLREQLKSDFVDRIDFDHLLTYFERIEVGEGHELIREGEESDSMYLIERGQVTAKLEMIKDKDHRLRTMCAGAVVGELGMILNEPRTATVVADRASIIYKLSKDNLSRMEKEAPDLAVAFLEFITHLVSERLANANRTIRVLLE